MPQARPDAAQTRRGGAQVRIIGGTLRRRRIEFPDLPGLRPTPDRVRETLFNWLGQDLTGLVCLDAFAGSGALGFEALSRGAAHVLLLEREPRALAALRANLHLLGGVGAEVVAADAPAFLRQPGPPFDLIFLDPPFATDLLATSLPAAAARLAAGGRIYVESPRALSPEAIAACGLVRYRQGRAGASHHCLLELA